MKTRELLWRTISRPLTKPSKEMGETTSKGKRTALLWFNSNKISYGICSWNFQNKMPINQQSTIRAMSPRRWYWIAYFSTIPTSSAPESADIHNKWGIEGPSGHSEAMWDGHGILITHLFVAVEGCLPVASPRKHKKRNIHRPNFPTYRFCAGPTSLQKEECDYLVGYAEHRANTYYWAGLTPWGFLRRLLQIVSPIPAFILHY
jgi:hypothetical protein